MGLIGRGKQVFVRIQFTDDDCWTFRIVEINFAHGALASIPTEGTSKIVRAPQVPPQALAAERPLEALIAPHGMMNVLTTPGQAV